MRFRRTENNGQMITVEISFLYRGIRLYQICEYVTRAAYARICAFLFSSSSSLLSLISQFQLMTFHSQLTLIHRCFFLRQLKYFSLNILPSLRSRNIQNILPSRDEIQEKFIGMTMLLSRCLRFSSS